VDVHVARPAEDGVFEVVVLQIGDRMRHVRLAREERLLEDDLAASPDAADPLHAGR
jgi:hypothetical protein